MKLTLSAYIGLTVFVMLLAVALLAPWIAPYDPASDPFT